MHYMTLPQRRHAKLQHVHHRALERQAEVQVEVDGLWEQIRRLTEAGTKPADYTRRLADLNELLLATNARLEATKRVVAGYSTAVAA